MKRSLVILNLALVAALAIGAFGGSRAVAAEFHAGAAPITLTGTPTNHRLAFNAGAMTCTTITLTGEMPVVTTKQITLKPDFKQCTVFGFPNVTVDVNECDFLFTATGEMHIICPANKAIELTAPFCTVKIKAQNGLNATAIASNAGKTDFKFTTNIGGIAYDECGTPRVNGTYTGSTTVTGANAMKTPIDVWFE